MGEDNKINKFLKKLNKKNELSLAQSFDQFISDDGEVEFIKSDFYDLNRILSGNLFNFMPANKVLCLYGMEQTGKSLIMYNIIKNVQKQGYTPIIFDTENAISKDVFENHGIDTSKGMVIRVFTIEDLVIKYNQIIDLIKEEDRNGKYAFFLDSLGNVYSEKFLKDVGKNELKLDQGLLFRAIKAFMKMVMSYTTMYKFPFMFTNHMVGNPNKANKYVKDKPFGGYSIRYLCNQMVELTISQDKDSGKNVTGIEIKAVTIKNRIVPPFQIGQIKLSFTKGLENPFYGLLPVMEEFEMVEKAGNRWIFKHIPDRKFTTKEVYGNRFTNKIFTDEIVNKINDLLKTKGYQKIDLKLKEEIENLEDDLILDE